MARAGDGARADHDKVLDLFRAYDGQRDDDAGMTDLVESICQELVQPAEPEPPLPAMPQVAPAPAADGTPRAPPQAPRSAGLDTRLLTGESTQGIPH